MGCFKKVEYKHKIGKQHHNLMPNFGPKHTLAYGLNFVFGLTFVVAFAFETFHVYSGVCQLYLRLDATNDGAITVRQDHLPVCNLLLAFHAIFQVAWPLALVWAYGVASGICVRLCNNSCCCPTVAAAAPSPGAAGRDDGHVEHQADDSVVQQSPGCCQRCCLFVLLLDFRKSLRGSFRAIERRVFVLLAGLQVGITVYFGIFLASIVVGYAVRCSIADSRDQVRLYRSGLYGTASRSSYQDVKNMVARDTLRRADLCFTNPITMTVLVSACCSYACNVANLVMYIWRWLGDGLDSL